MKGFGEATSLGEGKLWIQTSKLCLKIDLVSYPARAEELGKYGRRVFTRNSLPFSLSSHF